MLVKGFCLGKNALMNAKFFDEKLTSITSSSLDQKIGLSEKISAGTVSTLGGANIARYKESCMEMSTTKVIVEIHANSFDSWHFQEGMVAKVCAQTPMTVVALSSAPLECRTFQILLCAYVHFFKGVSVGSTIVELSVVIVSIFRAAAFYRDEHYMWYSHPEYLTPWIWKPVLQNGKWKMVSFMIRLLNGISSLEGYIKLDSHSHLEVLTEVLLDAYAGAIEAKLGRDKLKENQLIQPLKSVQIGF
ncbi:Nuclear pore complex protein NUP133 [Linum perenne]